MCVDLRGQIACKIVISFLYLYCINGSGYVCSVSKYINI